MPLSSVIETNSSHFEYTCKFYLLLLICEKIFEPLLLVLLQISHCFSDWYVLEGHNPLFILIAQAMSFTLLECICACCFLAPVCSLSLKWLSICNQPDTSKPLSSHSVLDMEIHLAIRHLCSQLMGDTHGYQVISYPDVCLRRNHLG